MKDVDYKNKIEALLFASGRFLDIDTLLNLTGVSGKQVLRNNIEKLKQEYDSRDSPLMVVEEKDGWKLTVREKYLSLVRKIVSETELPKTILETLAIIAWKAPVLQSEVVHIRHNKAYDHISELQDLGFIRKEPSGRSFIINLTEKFFEYFDVEGSRNIRDVFKKVLAKAETKDTEEALIDEIAKADQIAEKVKEKLDTKQVSDEEFSELDDIAQEDKSSEDEFNELDDTTEESKVKLPEEEFSELDDEEKTED